MLQALVVVAPPSNLYTVSTMLFHNYEGSNVAVTNCMKYFYILSQVKTLQNWLMETWYMPKKLLTIYVFLLTVPLYIQWNTFIIFQVTLATSSH